MRLLTGNGTTPNRATQRCAIRAVKYWNGKRVISSQNRLDDWLAMFAPECVYWGPATPHGGDPRKEIANFFDDRRRMEDRVFRLKNDYAWSQRPMSRTARLVSNVTAFSGDSESVGDGSVELFDYRVPSRRQAHLYGLERAPVAAQGWQLGNLGKTGQSDRLRPELAQSQHHLVKLIAPDRL